MSAESSGLDDLILRFEVPLPDVEFPEIVRRLGDEALRRSASAQSTAGYPYLLGRVYELLGYCVRHTPWLTNSPKSYWQKSVAFFEQALLRPLTPSHKHFLEGKLLLRKSMIYTIDLKDTLAGEGDDLARAAERFDSAAEEWTDESFKAIAGDLSVIARTEALQRQARLQLRSLVHDSRTWDELLPVINEKVSAFCASCEFDLPSSIRADRWPAHHALGKARWLYAQAHVREVLSEHLRRAPNGATVEPRRSENERAIHDCYTEASNVCDRAGLAVRAAHTRVAILRRDADAALDKCIDQFKRVRKSEEVSRAELLARAAPRPRVLPTEIGVYFQRAQAEEKRIRVPDELIALLRQNGVRISDGAMLSTESASAWVISDRFDRYLVKSNGELTLTDLTKQPIAFDPDEAQRFEEFRAAVAEACRLYSSAGREITAALKTAAGLYEQITSYLRDVTSAIRDQNLTNLLVTTASMLEELESPHYPLLDTLRERTRYAWSLLEMFQMRNGAVRLGTLFSGQCRLMMRNPFYDAAHDASTEEFIEIGADPVFQTTVDFIFRGAKGEKERNEFQSRALTATLRTIKQQQESLLTETRYVDETGNYGRRATLARLECHRHVALALREFTPIFIAQRPQEMLTMDIRARVRTIHQHLTEAKDELNEFDSQPSTLIDVAGIEAIQEYIDGVATGLIGMNQVDEKSAGWATTYQFAIEHHRNAKEKLRAAGDVRLLPAGKIRQDYMSYVEARGLTVRGFEARHRAEESGKADDYRRAAEIFEEAHGIFADTLRDYRIATKASARALEMRSLAFPSGTVTRNERYKLLKEANALYAACGDAAGFDSTWQRLRNEFPLDEAATPAPAGPVTIPTALSVPQTPSTAAKTKLGDYDVQVIGEGGMAIVYRAEKRDGRVVALKMVRPEYVDNVEYLQRFLREINVCMDLHHPNIIRIHDRGDVQGVPYFTMELLKGETLEAVVDRKQPVEPLLATRIVMGIAEALEYLHGKGFVHRDLKPSNVMLMDGKRVKVMDFGIARSKRFAKVTRIGDAVFTPAYAAPEQLAGADADHLSDLYSLGLIYFQLLTGAEPLDFRRRHSEEHPSPMQVLPAVPAPIDRMTAKLLARDRKARYASAEDFLRDVHAFAGADLVD